MWGAAGSRLGYGEHRGVGRGIGSIREQAGEWEASGSRL